MHETQECYQNVHIIDSNLLIESNIHYNTWDINHRARKESLKTYMRT